MLIKKKKVGEENKDKKSNNFQAENFILVQKYSEADIKCYRFSTDKNFDNFDISMED